MEIAATTHPSPAECLFFGVDLQTWVNEGLVDKLLPMGFSHGGPDVDPDYYLGLLRGTACKLFPFLPVGKQPRNGSQSGIYMKDAIYEKIYCAIGSHVTR